MANPSANTFTVLLNANVAFIIPATSGVSKVSFQYVSGTVTIRGNFATLPTTTTAGVASSVADTVITLSSTISALTLVSDGISPVVVTVDASAGSAAMIAYL